MDGLVVAEHGRLIRRALAIGLAVAVGLMVLSRLWIPGLPGPTFGSDLEAYLSAADRQRETGQPYSPELLQGPIENRFENVPIAYFYTPVLAQVLALVRVDMGVLEPLWVGSQLVLLAVLIPLLYRAHGGARSWIGSLVVVAVAAASQPLNFAVFIGNVSGWIAIVVAVMLLDRGTLAGISGAAIGIVKSTAAPLALVAVIARGSRRSALATLVVLVGVSVALAPSAWVAFIRVVPNVLLLPLSDSAGNWSPAALARGMGLEPGGRLLGLALTALGVLLAIRWARRRGELGRAIAAATIAGTFAGSTVWDHYLAAIVPLTIAAWPGAGPRRRVLLAVGYGWHLVPWVVAPADPILRLIGLGAIVASIAGLLGGPIERALADDQEGEVAIRRAEGVELPSTAR